VVTARELSLELEVSERTVYRDIQALMQSGVPLEGEAGIGYLLRKEFELPPLMFTVEEARALVLGARMVQAWGDAGLQKAAARLLDKVRAVAPASVRNAFDDPTLAVPDMHIDPAFRVNLRRIREAIHAQKKVHFVYNRLDDTRAERTVRPLGLSYWGKVWLLAGWCELREDFRTFRIDRMDGLCVLDIGFEPEQGKSLQDYLGTVGES
jgi:predicted DNA-binding transcriptional regulator YafY